MRAAFFLLLLVNLMFFAWARWVDVPRTEVAAPSDVPQLRLAAATDAPGATLETAECFTLGPFADDPSTATAVGVLAGAGFRPQQRLVDADVADGYWVYVPALRDAAARRRALTTLRGAGVRDAAVVTVPDQSERVSAGVFTDQSRAELRAAQVRFAGLDAVVEARQRHVSEHWLDFHVPQGETVPSLSDFGAGSAAPLKLERCAGG